MPAMRDAFVGVLPQARSFDDGCFAEEVAKRLRARHPVHTAKNVARDLNCTPKTAENILAGHLSGRSIARLSMVYGLGFLIDVGAAVTGTTLRDFIVAQADDARREQIKAMEREREFTELEEGLAAGGAERRRESRRLPERPR